MEVNTGSYRKMRNGNGKIPWKVILAILGILGVGGGGGWKISDVIADVKADAALALKVKQDTVITPLAARVEKHGDSIGALETAVGVIASKVKTMGTDVGALKADMKKVSESMIRQETLQGEMMKLLQKAYNGDSAAGHP